MLDRMTFPNPKLTNWFKNYTNWLPFVEWAGWILVVFLIAKTTWLWTLHFTQTEQSSAIFTASATANPTSNQISVDSLINRHLFGQITVKPVQDKVVVQDAPVTKLNLKLRGIYASETLSKANAIIEDGSGKQSVYFIDEKLKVGGRVYLRQVFVDRIMLETNGKNEVLKLEQNPLVGTSIRSAKTGPLAQKNDKKTVDDKRNNSRISKKLSEYKKKLINDPRSVSDVISGRPSFVDGELRGFNISPGKDKRLFQELGLRSGDLVTSINGVSLTNMQDAMTLMNEANSMDSLSIDIDRNGETISLLLNLNDKVGM
jgi:general secretion pathway protein C